MPRKQCEKCPWKVSTNPGEIPNGYCRQKHAALKDTIADSGAPLFSGTLRVMACHETPVGGELPCIGWLANQLGPGNNIGLRLAALSGRVATDFELDGPQYERFADTLPAVRP